MTTEADKYTIMKNEETGAEVYQCNLCPAKFGTKKSIKTHGTTKHKVKKPNEEKSEEVKESEVEVEGFEFADVEAQSTQKEKEPTAEEIARFYESNEGGEFLSSEETEEPTDAPPTDKPLLSNETVNGIVAAMEEEENETNSSESVGDLETEIILLKSKLNEAQSQLKEKDQKLLEMETNMIDVILKLLNSMKKRNLWKKI